MPHLETPIVSINKTAFGFWTFVLVSGYRDFLHIFDVDVTAINHAVQNLKEVGVAQLNIAGLNGRIRG